MPPAVLVSTRSILRRKVAYGFDFIAVIMSVNQLEGSAMIDSQRDAQVLLELFHVRRCAHDLVDRADFRTWVVVQPFLAEL